MDNTDPFKKLHPEPDLPNMTDQAPAAHRDEVLDEAAAIGKMLRLPMEDILKETHLDTFPTREDEEGNLRVEVNDETLLARLDDYNRSREELQLPELASFDYVSYANRWHDASRIIGSKVGSATPPSPDELQAEAEAKAAKEGIGDPAWALRDVECRSYPAVVKEYIGFSDDKGALSPTTISWRGAPSLEAAEAYVEQLGGEVVLFRLPGTHEEIDTGDSSFTRYKTVPNSVCYRYSIFDNPYFDTAAKE